ncbi:MAG: hypothetical protein WDN25_24045 [Acetobacteraceae bacterium]
MTPYLLVDGRRVAPVIITQTQLGFFVKFPAREIRLISGSGSPEDLEGSSDRRRLGVLLRRLRWERDGEAIDVPLDLPCFIDGFHHVEVHNPEVGPVRWTTGNAALPPMTFPPWQGMLHLNLTLGEWRGSGHETPVTPEAALLSGFESLGQDCEFGLAQRHYLVEPPLTLFRWGGAPVDGLIQGLESRFAGLTDPGTTDLVWGYGEYFVRTPYVTMHTHCLEECDEAGQADVLRAARATLGLLRRKLLKDIAETRRIFVFKGLDAECDVAAMRRLHAALRRIGPASLLCVTLAPPGQPVGCSERIAEGLYAGYVDRFVMHDGPFDQWLSICAGTRALIDCG